MPDYMDEFPYCHAFPVPDDGGSDQPPPPGVIRALSDAADRQLEIYRRELAEGRVRVIERAVQVFGSEDAVEEWMYQPLRGPGSTWPDLLFDSQTGIGSLLKLLDEIESSKKGA